VRLLIVVDRGCDCCWFWLVLVEDDLGFQVL
jgi:hypothetical protein